MYVDPDFRKKGYATQLINFLIDKVRKYKEIEQIELKVNSRNKSAIALYEKLGFKRIAQLPHAVKEPDGTYQDEFIYSFSLKNFH